MKNRQKANKKKNAEYGGNTFYNLYNIQSIRVCILEKSEYFVRGGLFEYIPIKYYFAPPILGTHRIMENLSNYFGFLGFFT